MRISDILRDGRVHFSCEVFPPKAVADMEQAAAVTREIAALEPDFISVTYGAAGKTPAHTLELARVVEQCGRTSLCHLTCLQSTRAQVEDVLTRMQAAGLENVLALRGDPPKDGPAAGDFPYAAALIRLIKARGNFCVGAACYPEGHPESPTRDKDLDYLKAKVDAGADFLTTQMFFDNNVLYRFLYHALRRGIEVPVVAGVMPITDTRLLKRTVLLSGATLPPRFLSMADRFHDQPAAMAQAGVAFATEQIVDLVANGVQHIHVYTMNKPWIARAIRDNLSEVFGHAAL